MHSRYTHPLQQAQRFGVGTDQDVLPVVEFEAVHTDASRASAQLRCHLEQRDTVAQPRRFDCAGQTGPATADHGHAQRSLRHRPRQFVRMAIQSLRSGVSEVRWCST